MEKTIHLNIQVKGRVQGVGFRWTAAREAAAEGINGFVKNMPDGIVYIEAEGPESRVFRFVDWCRRGPSFSEVDSVVTTEGPVLGFIEFQIKH
jgi:acylphosphatase